MGAVDAATSDTSGVVEVDLVFPRNDTYAPGPYVPIVFAVQTPELATLLNLRIGFQIWNTTNGSIVDEGSFGDSFETGYFNWTNTSSNSPEFVYRHYEKFNTGGKWNLVWNVLWANCTYDARREKSYLDGQSQSSLITFTTNKTAQDIDLVDATTDDDCREEQGIAFNVMDTTVVAGGYNVGEQCAVLENTTLTPSPCRVKIDSTTASSMSAALTASLCSDEYRMYVEAGWAEEPQISCPVDTSAAQQLLVGGISCLMVGIGAFSYLFL
jgi:hypothetical protein